LTAAGFVKTGGEGGEMRGGMRMGRGRIIAKVIQILLETTGEKDTKEYFVCYECEH
jgi:hypothetical protein